MNPLYQLEKPPLSHKVIGVRLDYISPEHFIASVVFHAKSERGGYCIVSNVHQTILSHDEREHRRILDSAKLVVSDSKVLEMSRAFLHSVPAQKTIKGSEILESICCAMAKERLPVGFVGGKNAEVLDRLIREISTRIPELRIVYKYSPPFWEQSIEEEEEIAEDIRHSGAKLVFVGLGCPKQERWMARYDERTNCFKIGVGAAFDFISGEVKSSPNWIHRIGFEWLWRLAHEPRRLSRRYLKTSPRFLLLLFLEKIKTY